jgi:ABC-type branched-subunit amino acid transport system substrate-binding protein
MTRSRRARVVALAAAAVLLVAACGDDDDSTTNTTAAGPGTTAGGPTDTTTGSPDTTTGTTPEGWAVDTSSCPDGVSDPIEGTVKIGTTMPLSGGAAALAFAPVADGLKAFVQFANDNELLPGYTLELTIEDDQFNSTLTTPAVESLLDDTGVNLFTGMIGTANNLAVRELLNQECYPQLLANSGSPAWGDVANFPWTTGALAPYNTETAIYVENIQQDFPDGATAAIFNVNSEFGQVYVDTFTDLAPDAGIDIVEEQTIESADSNPPTSQVNAIAAQAPDVILAVPLGAQCPAFLSELANAKATNAGWEPRVYITSTCASTLLLGLAGPAADGIYTTVATVDPADPANASNPAVVELKDGLDAYGFAADGDVATAAAGWQIGVLTLEILKNAADSADGLSRESIINAARNFSFSPPLAREGVTLTMSGEDDPYLLESLQVVQYSADSKTYTDIGDLNTEFEGQTELPS